MRPILKWSIICAALVLLFIASFFLGKQTVAHHEPTAAGTSASSAEDALAAFRTERQQLRQMQLSQLSEIIHSDDSDPSIISLAQQRQLELMVWSEQELTIEGVLSMRGFDDVVATVHTDSINIMVRADAISQQEAAVILELVMRETGISGGNVKIIPLN